MNTDYSTNLHDVMPKLMPVQPENIPDELKKLSQWVLWKYIWNAKSKKWDKVPFQGSNPEFKASSTNPKTWASFDVVMGAYNEGDASGIGFVVTEDDPYMGVDLDKCKGDEWAKKIIRELNSYTEVTPSDNGHRVWIKANKPEDFKNKSTDFHSSKVEIYSEGRFFTVTGNGSKKAIEQRQKQLELSCSGLKKDVKVRNEKAPATAKILNDDELLRIMFKICSGSESLYNVGAGEDHSASDLALCNHLAFMTGRDFDQIDRLFRQSKLMRQKWDEVHSSDGLTYGQMTILKAIEDTQNIFDSNHKSESASEYKVPFWAAKIQPEFYVLPEQAKGHFLIDYALEVARATEFPEGSTVFTALGAFSAAASLCYCVQYEDGANLPLGLYTTIEQPPSMSKSRILNKFIKPLQTGLGEVNFKIYKFNQEADDDSKIPPVSDVLTNGTAEGIEKKMTQTCSGRFIVSSAEQGAVNQILSIDGNRTTDKDLMLKGYNGEYHSSVRVSRQGFSGEVYGAVILIAQLGMTKKILQSSGGEGLAERFLFLSEPHLLGKRTHSEAPVNMMMEVSYKNKINFLTGCFELMKHPRAIEKLMPLRFKPEGYQLLLKYKREIEPMLAEYVNRGAMLLASALGKFDIHAMKIASCLHIADHVPTAEKVPNIIEVSYLELAIEIVMRQFRQLELIMEREGETGEAGRRETVLRKFDSSSRNFFKMRELVNHLKNVKPFRDMPEPYQTAKDTIVKMLHDGELYQDPSGKISVN